MNKKINIIKNKKPKKFVSSYGDKVFDTLAELMKYEAEMDAKVEAEEKKEHKLPYQE